MNLVRPIEDLFSELIALKAPAEREAYLDNVCGQDKSLRGRLEKLLAAHNDAGSFLQHGQGIELTADVEHDARLVASAIGPYKLRELIGEGGMGVVYVAEQTEPVRRKVALKVIKPALANREATARFEAERQALAMMDHPHIARVYDGGTTDNGQPFFVMELVQGLPITEFCDRKRCTTRARIELFLHVCRAVQHAHQRGIIHRDIKPSNVLVPEIDGVAVPKVIDFGVAKAVHQKLTDRTVYTQFSQMVGTPLYMSPEQADLGVVDVDTRTDVYSLGVLLYELLTGNTPFDRERISRANIDEMRRIIRDEEPRRPSVLVSTLKADAVSTVEENRGVASRSLRESLSGELDWIVMKALEKDRNRRYESPASLAADLQRYLDDRPVEARPPSRSYLFQKFVRRHKLAVGFASAIAVSLLLGLIGTSTGMFRALAAEKKAQEAGVAAEKQAHRSQRLLYVTRIRLAYQHLLANRPVDALAQLKLCPEASRDWEWSYLVRTCHATKELSIRTDAWVYAIHLHPYQDTTLVEVKDRKVVQVGNMGSDNPVTTSTSLSSTKGGEGVAGTLGYRPNGDLLAISSDRRSIVVLDSNFSKKAEVVAGYRDEIERFVLNLTGSHLAFQTKQGDVKVWDVKRRTEIASLPDGEWSVCLSPNAEYVALSRSGDAFEVWDLKNDRRHFRGTVHTGPVFSMCFSPDGDYLATSSFDSTIGIWNVETGKLVSRWRAGHSNLYSIAFNPSGTRLASTGEDGTIRIWDWRADDEKELLRFRHTKGKGFDVVFSTDGTKLLAGGSGSQIRVFDGTQWSPQPEREPIVLSANEANLNALAISPSGKEVAVGGEGGVVRTWDLQSGDPKRIFTEHGVGRVVWEIAYGPEGQFIISTGGNDISKQLSTIRWDPNLAQTTGESGFHMSYDRPCLALDIHPDGRQFVQGSAEGQLSIHDANSGAASNVFGAHESQIRSIRYSPDRPFVVSLAEDGTLMRWDATRLDERQEGVLLDDESEGRIAFFAQGRKVVAGHNDGLVVVNIDTLEKNVIPAHGAPVSECAFSQPLGLIASASLDGTVKLWNADTLELVDTLLADGALFRVAFSPDGHRLIAVGEQPEVMVWNIDALLKSATRPQANEESD